MRHLQWIDKIFFPFSFFSSPDSISFSIGKDVPPALGGKEVHLFFKHSNGIVLELSFIIRLSISGNWIVCDEMKTKWMLNAESKMCCSRLFKCLQRYCLNQIVMWNMFNVQEHFEQKKKQKERDNENIDYLTAVKLRNSWKLSNV